MSQRSALIDRIRTRKGLGRRPAPDERDQQHPMSAVLRRAITSNDSKIWAGGAILDQGSTSMCVAYAWTGFLLATPMRSKLATLGGATYIGNLYHRAQQLDEWPGEDYDGTSTRAGAKALTEQGHLQEYIWAWDEPTIRQYVLTRGPVVFGIDWLEEMFAPIKGYLQVVGAVAGGHDILCLGYSRSADAYRLAQSWGKNWGQNGRVWLRRLDLIKLLEQGGECCSGIQSTL